MSVSLGANGASYNYPEEGDYNYGTNATNFASAVSAALAKVGLGSTLTNNAVIDISSTTKGVLIPRMTTTQRDAIGTPSTGLLIYNTTTNKLNFYFSSAWHFVLNDANIIDSLVSSSTTDALSANQGIVLSNTINAVNLGTLDGGLIFNSTTLPPTVIAGLYNVSSKNIQKTANDTLALTDTLLQSRQALEAYCQYVVAMDSSGNVKYCLYGENQVATGTITSITGSGTTKTITFATGSSASAANKILVIYGNDGVNGVFKIASDTSNTVKTFESVSTVTGGASGTWVIYDRINTLHGTGSATSITTDASVGLYTPGYGQNGWASGIVAYDPTKCGFYLTISGLTDYRVIGNFRTNSSSQVQTNVISHKSRDEKNDNEWFLYNISSLVTNAIRWTTIGKMFGNDYVFVDSAGVGSEMTLKRRLKINATSDIPNTGGSVQVSILLGTSSNTMSSTSIDQFYNDDGSGYPVVSYSAVGNVNDAFKILGSSATIGSNASKFIGYMEIT